MLRVLCQCVVRVVRAWARARVRAHVRAWRVRTRVWRVRVCVCVRCVHCFVLFCACVVVVLRSVLCRALCAVHVRCVLVLCAPT